MNVKSIWIELTLPPGSPDQGAAYLKETAHRLYKEGADGLVLTTPHLLEHPDETDPGWSESAWLETITGLYDVCDLPLMVRRDCARLEDIKKTIYAGARSVIMDPIRSDCTDLMKEGITRFGSEAVAGCISPSDQDPFTEADMDRFSESSGVHRWILPAQEAVLSAAAKQIGIIAACSSADLTQLTELLSEQGTEGVLLPCDAVPDIRGLKEALSAQGVPVALRRITRPYSDFKTDARGLIPVIVQDDASNRVLMLAYMNQEAYACSVKTGLMTYYSRSRDSLWVKGETSGHYQFIKSLDIDCDCDTILARVKQVGPACHTGHTSCFFTPLSAKETEEKPGISAILEEIMATVRDRRENPREGSYTNYLFDKGIDKILKKVGEEATEIVIAAKNPDPAELTYEISDFLYHLVVLMAERGLTWEEIGHELKRRH